MTGTSPVGVRRRRPPAAEAQAPVDRDEPLFSVERRAPRRRRPVDIASLILASLGLAALWWGVERRSPLDQRVALLVRDLPDWLELLAWCGYSGAGVYALWLTAAGTRSSAPGPELQRDLFTALALVVGVGLLAGRSVIGAWPDVLPELFTVVGPATFPALRLALVLTVVLVHLPYLTSPHRRLGRYAVAGAAIGTLLLGFTTVSGIVAGSLLAWAGASAAAVAFGSPSGLPTIERLQSALVKLGLELDGVAYEDVPGVVGRASALGPSGPVEIKVFGRDAADRHRAERAWRLLWYRGNDPVGSASPIRQVEHEAFILDRAAKAVPVPRVLAAGTTADRDGVLVLEGPPGTSLDATAPAEAQVVATQVWRTLRRLHAAGILHGAIGPDAIRIAPDATVVIRDLGSGTVEQRSDGPAIDRAAALLVLAADLGETPAIDGMLAALPRDEIEPMVPYIQSGAVTSALRRHLEARGVDIDDVRAAACAAAGLDEPKLVELRRVTPAAVGMAAFGVLAANAIVSQIASVGFDTLLDQLEGASPAWLVVALLVRLAGYASAILSLRAVLDTEVPAGPTALLQSAKSFIGLAVPSAIGRAAMDVRFLQKLGASTATAVTQGPLIGLVGFLVEVGILLSTSFAVQEAFEGADLTAPSIGGLAVLALVVTAIGVTIVLVVDRIREVVLPFVIEAWRSVHALLRAPARLIRLVAGEVAERFAGALALACVIVAFGAYEDVSFAAVLFAYVGVNLLAGIAPVPGGIGVAEALLTGLLTGIGLEADQAFAVAITFRMLTSYLPPALGFFSLRWLTRNGYL